MLKSDLDVTFNLDSARMFSAAIFERYSLYHKAATNYYYMYFCLTLPSPEADLYQLIHLQHRNFDTVILLLNYLVLILCLYLSFLLISVILLQLCITYTVLKGCVFFCF